MASSKRRPGKSKRYRQNKAQREAREARSARAGEATAIARGELDPLLPDVDDAAVDTKASGRTTDGSSGGNKPSSKQDARAARAAAAERRRQNTVPGQRAVLLAFLFTVVSAITLVISPVGVRRDVPPDDPRVEAADREKDDDKGDDTVEITDEVKLFEEESAPVAVIVLLAPVAIAGGALWFTKREKQRSLAWTIAMVTMAGYTFVGAPYSTFSIVALMALAVAGFQARRAESKDRVAELKAQRAARKAARRGGVIDVDSTEVDPDDDE